MDYNSDEKFEGTCEMDGVYVNHYVRPKNNIETRVDRRKVHKPNKRVVISLRQRAEDGDEVVGAIKTKTFVLKSENSIDIKTIAHKYIKVGTTIHTDESNTYDDLTAHYNMNRVNHQIEYKAFMEKTIIKVNLIMQDLEECNMETYIKLEIYIFQIMQMK